MEKKQKKKISKPLLGLILIGILFIGVWVSQMGDDDYDSYDYVEPIVEEVEDNIIEDTITSMEKSMIDIIQVLMILMIVGVMLIIIFQAFRFGRIGGFY